MRLLISLLILCGFAFNIAAAAQQPQPAKEEPVFWDELRRINPGVVDAFKQATARMQAKDYRGAAADFEKVVKGAPAFEQAWKRLAMCYASSGNPERAIIAIDKALALNRSHDNLMTLAVYEAFPGAGKKATPEAQQRALRLMTEANQLKSDASALFVTASLAMQLKQHKEFGQTTLQMMRDFPDKPESHYLNAIHAASNREWSTAEEEIKRAGDLGLPPDMVRQFLDSGVHSRANEWRYATYVGYASIVWAVGLALLFVLGKALSRLTLRSIERSASSKVMVSPGVAGLRRIYRLLIQIAGWYYYISLPFVALLLIAVAGSVFYAFLALGRLPFRLLLVLVVMTAITIYKMFQSLFIRITPRDPGRILKLEEAPRLWALTKEVAADLGTRAVDEIRITPGTDVAVYEKGTRKEKAKDKAKRILILGVGVLNGFRLQAFRAVLAHEYGHFTNRDTAGGDIALRVNKDMMKFAYAMATVGQAVPWNLGFLFFRLYHFLFRRIGHGASRLQEILADRMAALKFGANAFEEGLTHAIRRSIEFPVAAGREIVQAVHAGRGVSNLYALSIETEPSVEDEIQKALRRPTSEDDTHPSANDRFRLVRQFGNTDQEIEAAEVWDLFEDRESIMMEMTILIDNSIERPGTPSANIGVPTFREVHL